jgi:hypothetical protein
LPIWLQNTLVLAGLLAVASAFVGAAMFCEHQGWTVAKYVVVVVGLVYDVFAALALLGYLLYVLDGEVRRGLNR